MAKIAIPTIHMNGTSRNDLMEAMSNAAYAIEKAEEAMGKVCPNGRDYYPQGPDAIQEALRQHHNRLHHLHAVRTELMEILEAIAD